ncbi:MAG: SDR family NAD(P)-dependent oxidoreductase, partial [Halioglobus sp.]|nr:SDR family NAD(P)-dependent oxidoreductase [Halioglobus sp.]
MAYTEGKIAVITGAGSGIGRALAQQLNAAGCRLHLSDINADALAETVVSLSRKDLRVQTRVVDVAQRADMHAWADEVA